MSMWKKVFSKGKSKEDKSSKVTEEVPSEADMVEQGTTMIFGIKVKKLPAEVLEEIETLMRTDAWKNTADIAVEVWKRFFDINELEFLVKADSTSKAVGAAEQVLRRLRVLNSYLNSFDVDPLSSTPPQEQRRLMFIHLVMIEIDDIKHRPQKIAVNRPIKDVLNEKPKW